MRTLRTLALAFEGGSAVLGSVGHRPQLGPRSRTVILAVALVVGLLSPALLLGAARPAAAAVNDPLLVAGYDTANVAIIDLTTGASFYSTVPSYPAGLAIAPNGSTAWVGDADAGVTPFKIQPPQSAGTRIGQVRTVPEGMVLTPDGNTMYLEDAHYTVAVNLTTAAVGPQFGFGTGTSGLNGHVLAISPNGKTVYNHWLLLRHEFRPGCADNSGEQHNRTLDPAGWSEW